MSKLCHLTDQELELVAGGQSRIPIIGPLIDWITGGGRCSYPGGGGIPTGPNPPNHRQFPTPAVPVPGPGRGIPRSVRPID
jgi:hypothetical protein